MDDCVVQLGRSPDSKGRVIYGIRVVDMKQIPDEYKKCECYFRTDQAGEFLTFVDRKLLYVKDKGVVCSV